MVDHFFDSLSLICSFLDLFIVSRRTCQWVRAKDTAIDESIHLSYISDGGLWQKHRMTRAFQEVLWGRATWPRPFWQSHTGLIDFGMGLHSPLAQHTAPFLLTHLPRLLPHGLPQAHAGPSGHPGSPQGDIGQLPRRKENFVGREGQLEVWFSLCKLKNFLRGRGSWAICLASHGEIGIEMTEGHSNGKGQL